MIRANEEFAIRRDALFPGGAEAMS
jgi:hypothetical protein